MLTKYRLLVAAILFPLCAANAWCQKPASATHKDVAYDSQDPAQSLDVYLVSTDHPAPVMIFYHGGGWRAGSKRGVPAWLLRGVKNNLFSVVSVEYRFTDVASHPAQTDDCLRAIQFVRHHATEWNIDTDRIGVTGGSAGGHLCAWVALHDDVADADSADPVLKLSSRVALAVPFAGPTDWTLLKEIPHLHPAYRQLIGSEPGTAFGKLSTDKIKDVSPITFVSDDDPPMMIIHGDADQIVPVQHARRLYRELLAKKVESELVIVPGASHAVAGAGDAAFIKRAEEFVRVHFDLAHGNKPPN